MSLNSFLIWLKIQNGPKSIPPNFFCHNSINFYRFRKFFTAGKLQYQTHLKWRKVCVQDVLKDVGATAWPLHRWTPAGDVPSLRSYTTSAGRRHESGCGRHSPAASARSDSQPGWGQDCRLATELEWWSLGSSSLTVAWSDAPGGQVRCPVEVKKSQQCV